MPFITIFSMTLMPSQLAPAYFCRLNISFSQSSCCQCNGSLMLESLIIFHLLPEILYLACPSLVKTYLFFCVLVKFYSWNKASFGYSMAHILIE